MIGGHGHREAALRDMQQCIYVVGIMVLATGASTGFCMCLA